MLVGRGVPSLSGVSSACCRRSALTRPFFPCSSTGPTRKRQRSLRLGLADDHVDALLFGDLLDLLR
jgi:hypothetical protein